MYCIDDRYFDDIDDVIRHITEIEDKDIEDFSDDYTLEVECCDLEPIFQLNSENLYELLLNTFEERSSDSGDEWDKVEDILKKHIDFEALNNDIPKLWFPNGKTETYSKNQLIEFNK